MLVVEDLSVAYDRIVVVDGLSITVPEGEVRAIIGPNGAGKTSVLSAVCGRARPRHGHIRLDDRELVGLPPHRIAALGLILSPQGREVFGTLSVADNLEVGAYHHRKDRQRVAARRELVLDVFPALSRLLGQQGASLSGGEQQMLAIGRALMAQPRILLLDEPSASLAPAVVNLIFGVIAQLRDDGMTILIAEQNVPKALEVAQYVYVLSGGRLHHQGAPDAIADDEEVRAAYLGAALPGEPPPTVPETAETAETATAETETAEEATDAR